MRRSDAGRPARPRGFTLVEAVMVIAITGVVIGVIAVFIAPATTAYFASSTRAQLGDEADTALRRIGRDLAAALPNSTRVTGMSLELIPVRSAARYAVGTETGDPLLFGTPDSSFAIVGPALQLASGNQRLAWYNLGAGVPDADAYTQANVRIAANAAGSATSITLSGGALPPALQAPPYRVYAIEQPVTYRCDTTAETLTRYSGYGFLATQPDLPSGGSAAVLARHVKSCSFDYGSAAAVGYGVVTLRLQLGAQGETVSLYHAVHVDNLP
ncbi:PulJ/GspJ family protein [Roseateles cellulosilyticus]|uniref:Prepilin-type N-terminal cleavage/methylation domain-containing protein n=1 Tax=Pelomonas cellulosilytica TaxID=2906762 RepID=A0ABS8XYT5_9BURK|nr:prepilin-type N-terminal cleavage/methylation domain-containing protein [Pelomonas sp. P8]MCE4555868.1 prepilin-type N-terminal cleavage/methylation domain-containing protein [Pelomonas sp. P8]